MKPDALVVADLTPAQAAKLVVSNRGNRRPVYPSTITRWIVKGAKSRAGGRIRLRAIRRPGGWLIAADWVKEKAHEVGNAVEEGARKAKQAVTSSGKQDQDSCGCG